MSTRSDEDSRSEKEASARNTARDVPAAKFKEGGVGTVPPRGLRGPSLQPGQGAPEQINPDDVGLAVLRGAQTLDGPHVARAAQKRAPDPRSPSPTPVSVEVPRVRSIPPAGYPSTPPSPSARSIQSGTLISIGSVDPRAPTELSLPGPAPRPLSVSELAAYLGPGAVVDRTPAVSPRELPSVVESDRYFDPTLRPSAPSSESRPVSSTRGTPSTGAISSARPSREAESVAPAAQKFLGTPRSYSPVSAQPASVREPRPDVASSRRSPGSGGDVPPQFRIHSELDALRYEVREDTFDLRSASTQREPLASRKQLPLSDWTPHGPPSERTHRPSEPGARSSRRSMPVGFQTEHDTAPPTTDRVLPLPAQRASVPVTWVLGAAAFAVLLALIVAWVMHAPAESRLDSTPARAADGSRSAAAPDQVQQPAPEELELDRARARARARNGVPANSAAASATVPRSPLAPKASAARPPPSAAPASKPPVPAVAARNASDASDASDPSSKAHQSIY